MELTRIGFQIPQADPSDLNCHLAIDISKHPYISIEEKSGVTTLNNVLQVLTLSPESDVEISLIIDTSHSSLNNLAKIDLTLPIFYSFQEMGANIRWQPLISPEDNKPFSILFYVKIELVSPYLGVIGIDFGTTNTCVSFLSDEQNTLEENPEPKLLSVTEEGAVRDITEMPTLFTVDKIETVNKQLVPKITPLMSYETKPEKPQSLVRGIKRHLGTSPEQNVHKFLIGSKSYDLTTEELVASYLDNLQKKFIDLTHCHFGICGNTSPCNFSRHEKNALIRSYAKLNPPVGDANLNLEYDEATAAAIYYTIKDIRDSRTLYGYVDRFGIEGAVNRNLLVYDFGGGTIDISLLQIHGTSKEMRFKVLGNTSLMNIGGDNITLAFFKRMKAQLCYLLIQGQEVESMYSQRVKPKWYAAYERLKKDSLHLLERYLKNEKISSSELKDLEETIGKLFVTNFAVFPKSTFGYSDAYKLFSELWYACDEVKKRLCRNNSWDPFLFADTLNLWASKRLGITENHGLGAIQNRLQQLNISLEKDLYPFIIKPIRQSMRAMKLLCMKEGQTPDIYETIHEIRLAGNSSKIPLVKQLLIEEMQEKIIDENGNASQIVPDVEGILKDVDEDAKTCVSKGMTWALAINNGANNFRITIESQNEFLPYEIGFKMPFEPWHTMFKRGTKLPANHPYTPLNYHKTTVLPIYRRICKWHKVPDEVGHEIDEFNPPLYFMGNFTFLDKYAMNIPADAIDHISFTYTPALTLTAHKGDKVYPLIQNRELPKETDPFSGWH